jgi:predicted PurR-regulated permease PerM
VFLGLLGGIAAFGLLGVFIGPTLLAVGYTLLREWSHSKELEAIDLADDARASAPPPAGD